MQPIFDLTPVNGSTRLGSKADFLDKPIGELIGLTPESTHLNICNFWEPLTNLLDRFTRRKIHRVLVRERRCIEDEEVSETTDEPMTYYLSQSDVVQFLHANNHMLGEILDAPASDVANRGLRLQANGRYELLERPSSITIHDRALDAFRKIHRDRVNAVAVINDDGCLVGEVSAADMRGLNRDRVDDLMRPIVAFLNTSLGGMPEPLTCRSKFTLSQVMAGITRSKTHRVWLVDDDEVPIGVITLTDILSMFLPDASEQSPQNSL
jgi:CBS domain-containing protein